VDGSGCCVEGGSPFMGKSSPEDVTTIAGIDGVGEGGPPDVTGEGNLCFRASFSPFWSLRRRSSLKDQSSRRVTTT
jgi:hypothetical protein